MMNERRFIYITDAQERSDRLADNTNSTVWALAVAGTRSARVHGGGREMAARSWRCQRRCGGTECLEANGRRGGSSDGADRLDERRELHARLLVVARFAVDRRPFAARRVLRHVHAPVLRVRELAVSRITGW